MMKQEQSRSTKDILEDFKKEFIELLSRYPDVIVCEDRHDTKPLVGYACNDVDEAKISLQHSIRNWSY